MPVNELNALNLHLEHEEPIYISPEVRQSFADEVLVIGGDRVVENWHYIEMVNPYDGELSKGQNELYILLLTIQSASIYCSMTIGKLAQTLGIGVMPCVERLANLKSLGAVIGTIPK